MTESDPVLQLQSNFSRLLLRLLVHAFQPIGRLTGSTRPNRMGGTAGLLLQLVDGGVELPLPQIEVTQAPSAGERIGSRQRLFFSSCAASSLTLHCENEDSSDAGNGVRHSWDSVRWHGGIRPCARWEVPGFEEVGTSHTWTSGRRAESRLIRGPCGNTRLIRPGHLLRWRGANRRSPQAGKLR